MLPPAVRVGGRGLASGEQPAGGRFQLSETLLGALLPPQGSWGPLQESQGAERAPEEAGSGGGSGPSVGSFLALPAPANPPLACLISHQASAGPGRTPSPKPLWPLWPRGRAPPPLPLPHPLLGPPWPPALHSPQVGARAQRQPPPRPIRAESLPLSVCSAGGRGVSPGEGRGLALSAEDAGTPQPPECEAEGPPGRLDPPVPRPQPGLPSSSGMFFLLPLQGTAQGTETSTAKRTG